MWIHRTAILARIFDGTPDIFDDSVFALASLGAMVQVRLTKQAFEKLTSTLRGKHFVVMLLTVFYCASLTFTLTIYANVVGGGGGG